MGKGLRVNWHDRVAWVLIGLALVILLLPRGAKVKISQPLATGLLYPLRVIAHWRFTITEMSAENRRLAQLSAQLTIENGYLRSVLESQRYKAPSLAPSALVRAQVIARDITTLKRYMVVSWSSPLTEPDSAPNPSAASPAPGAVVLTPDGVLGRVIAVEGNQALIQTILEPSFRMTVLNSRSRELAVAHPEGKGLLFLNYAKKEADFLPGDTILTAGLGGVFPKNLPVGLVVELPDEPSGLFKAVYARPFVDVTRVEQVFLFQPAGEFLLPTTKFKIPEGE